MVENHEKMWSLALGELEVVLSKANFTTWFRDTFIYDYKKGVFTIGVPTFFIEDWLKKKYIREIKNALQKQTKEKIEDIKFRVSSPPQKPQKPVDNSKVIHRAVDNFQSYPHVDKPVDNPKNETLKEQYNFANFVVGTENQLAHAAAKAVADKPGKAYNPLYIYGGSGLGKTHLLQAIGRGVQEKFPNSKVLYAPCETFTNDFIEAVRSGRGKEFKDHYRSVDVLLVDDIQFLGTKEQTQEAFFHTFNHLHQKDKQVVMTSDRVPKEIRGLEKRLQTRLGWGMVADIQSPSFETRCAILKSKCGERGRSLDVDIIEFIAKNIESNVRELEAALTKLFAYCDLVGETPTIPVVERVLQEIIVKNQVRQVISVDRVLKTTAKFYQLSVEDLVSKKRNRELIRPRQIVMYILRNVVNLSFPQIGQVLGGKDHSTIMYGCKVINKEINLLKQTKNEIELLKESLFE